MASNTKRNGFDAGIGRGEEMTEYKDLSSEAMAVWQRMEGTEFDNSRIRYCTELYQQGGDMRLVWVNEGDLINHDMVHDGLKGGK